MRKWPKCACENWFPSELDLTAKPEIIVEMGPPAKVILRAAEILSSDLIVIGARGAGALARLSTPFADRSRTRLCAGPCARCSPCDP